MNSLGLKPGRDPLGPFGPLPTIGAAFSADFASLGFRRGLIVKSAPAAGLEGALIIASGVDALAESLMSAADSTDTLFSVFLVTILCSSAPGFKFSDAAARPGVAARPICCRLEVRSTGSREEPSSVKSPQGSAARAMGAAHAEGSSNGGPIEDLARDSIAAGAAFGGLSPEPTFFTVPRG